ncbi:dTDP-4-dehydrorhamnose 3,5-epimerase family protein [Vibrio aestuarianus]|uniref:dTDP-4-dehydrorhamnose 3,5-epimerase family protein n=1 Tax=Vibrio aestuarianus TaxID=28171 RepID=UPI00237C7718|nr:dTDP-4-dehydrorhamnose 3,5-epimerase family protein [Vibrio aestuarianus]MDE1326601.1 dTDP-4-dehydrorhamnose 3,5-epimerase family protein [Vibrio aestuarianus]
MIEGVIITPLKRISHEKGDIFHAMKQSEESFISFGEAYFSNIHFGKVKGWKKHSKMVLNLVVPVGSVRFVLFDDRQGSITNGEYFDLVVSSDNYIRLTIPKGIWMAFQGIGDHQNLLLNIASIEHDPLESTTEPLTYIPFEW